MFLCSQYVKQNDYNIKPQYKIKLNNCTVPENRITNIVVIKLINMMCTHFKGIEYIEFLNNIVDD